jgi:hypothetical protein
MTGLQVKRERARADNRRRDLTRRKNLAICWVEYHATTSIDALFKHGQTVLWVTAWVEIPKMG